MESSRLLHRLLLVGLLSILCHGQATREVSAENSEMDKPAPAADRDLRNVASAAIVAAQVEALEVLLGQTRDRTSSNEKRGSIPVCGMGDRCAMKFGPRIGKLCDCRRGASCNSYLLKCI
ncbi:cocaine- and amphetamine-regulated transcript-like [Nothobranchius furzeri]|uniref:Cocaine- and amphetamine-regulated transcript protein-like n=1 Tax=Nothobranchius furzeri TaxID=105023 RepID=A0A9D2Y2B9_NOTFU|nr:cocaine- and amphetamine-regulated transcript-like [Nothobranchius furzeri]KAF7212742.1 cocaine- and amphetamine-regulated transcript protein-like [Nothobranchius furzeri]